MQEQINKSKELDFIEELELKLKLNYGEELAQKILNDIYKISILEEIKNDNKKLKDFIKIENIMKKDLEKISNKEQYLQELEGVEYTFRHHLHRAVGMASQ